MNHQSAVVKFSQKHVINSAIRDADPEAHEYYSIKIHKLAQYGFLKELLAELQIHPKRINERNLLGESVLYKACEHGQKNVATVLLGLGAEPNYNDDDAESTSLMACAKYGRIDLGKMLLDRKAMINKVDEDNQTALIIACKHYQKDFAKLLLKYGANVEIRDCDGHDAVMICALSNQDDILKYLLHYGAGLNTRDYEANTPLMWACINGHRKVVRRLIDSGAEISLQNSFEWNCLMLAIMNGHIDVSLFLIDHGVPLHQLSRNRSTALTMACKYAYFELSGALVSRGCDLHHENYVGDTPLSLYGTAAYPPLTVVSIAEHKEKLIELSNNWKRLEYEMRVAKAEAAEAAEKNVNNNKNNNNNQDEVVNFDGTPQKLSDQPPAAGRPKGRSKKGSIVQYFKKQYEYLDTLKVTKGIDGHEKDPVHEDNSPENDRYRRYFDDERNDTIGRGSKKAVNGNEVVAFDDL